MNMAVGAMPDLTVTDNIRIQLAYGECLPTDLKDFVGKALAWAELENYADLPMRVLSPGMQARLYFSVATQIPGEIYIIDEWMGVGDAAFVKKANERFEEMVEKSKIFIFASHNPEILNGLCNKVLEIKKGGLFCSSNSSNTGSRNS